MYRPPNGKRLASIVAVVLMACSHGQAVVSQPSHDHVVPGQGLLVGRVTVDLPPGSGSPDRSGPLPGGSRVPFVGATIVVSPLAGNAVQSAVTDAGGEYAVSLLAGSY